MQNFIYKIQNFMRGRYGFDELNLIILAVSLIVNVAARFTFNYTARTVLRLVSLSLFVIFILRMLSRNCYQRSRENEIFKPFFAKTVDFFKLTYRRFKDGRTHRYYKCPSCKAQLRVKNIKGKHTIRCPKCKYQFQKKIR
ncbi:MAG: hypothetical protein J1E41_04830 [Ruminococcus sp.]|nr:hypothetical protein [Ruminococcus sp.]